MAQEEDIKRWCYYCHREIEWCEPFFLVHYPKDRPTAYIAGIACYDCYNKEYQKHEYNQELLKQYK